MEKKFTEIKPGQLFTIDNTTSYPKLRTYRGYIDMRDEIVKNCDDLPSKWKTSIMSKEAVAAKLDVTVEDVNNWIKRWL